MALITLTTDFGLSDPFVGIMKGVIAARAPGVPIIDVTHGVLPQQVLAGALVLQAAVPYFPPGTIHLAVVDPGVGGPRRPLCIETARGFLVGPDNGLLSLAAGDDTVRRIVHLTDERVFLAPRSHTFHGRDVFAPVAAALATGIPAAALGTEVSAFDRLSIPVVDVTERLLHGQVIYVDHFGNLATNVRLEHLRPWPGRRLTITVGGTRVDGLSATYGAVAAGEPLALVNSWGLLEIAVRDGSARATTGAQPGTPVVVEVGE
jgi:hypothetical protein